MNIYYGTFIDTPTPSELRIRHDTGVCVDEAGKIVFVEPAASEDDLRRLVVMKGFREASNITYHHHQSGPADTSFFFPGLIDTHTHASQYPNAGIFGSSTLLDWLETYTFPLESSFKDTSIAEKVYPRVVRRLLSHGTTAAAYYATVHVPATQLLADTCLRLGQRALIGRVCMDRMSPDNYRDDDADDSVSKTLAVIEHITTQDPDGNLIRPVITPRFAPSCTDACLASLGELHQATGHFVQTHISENLSEIELVKSQFPHAHNYASVYEDAGLLSAKTILAHAVHLTPAEIALVKHRDAKISHCPASNSCLASGAAPVKQFMSSGVTVGLGTDVSGGFSSSILEMARQALLVSRHRDIGDQLEVKEGRKPMDHGEESQKLSVVEALWLATRGGARVMGLEKKVGVFEVGMEFDALSVQMPHVVVNDGSGRDLIDSGPVDIFGWESWPNRVAKWVYGGDDRNIRVVYVKGRKVHSSVR